MGSPTRSDPYMTGNYLVTIDGVIENGSFSAVAGLEASIDVVDYRPGDQRENTAQKLPGLNKYPNVTLKRGLIGDLALWNWFNSGLTGTLVRASVTIALRDQADNPVLVWKLKNAWPCRWTGPVLVGNSSDVAIEEIEIAHEGLLIELAG